MKSSLARGLWIGSLAAVCLAAAAGGAVAGAVPITIDGAGVDGVLEDNTDENWYTFTVPPGSAMTVVVETTLRFHPSSIDTRMELYGADGTTLLETDEDGGDGNLSRIMRPLERGTYYVRVTRVDTLPGSRGYCILVNSVRELPLGSLVVDELTADRSQHWYRFEVTGIGLHVAATTGFTLDPVRMWVYDAAVDEAIAEARESSSITADPAGVALAGLTGGSYYVRIDGGVNGHQGTYDTVAARVRRLDLDGAGVPGDIAGETHEDWYRFVVTSAEDKEVWLEVTDAWGGTLSDSEMILVACDDQGRLTEGWSDRRNGDGELCRIRRSLGEGAYFVRVRGEHGDTGSYTVIASSSPVWLTPDAPPVAGEIGAPRSLHWYTFLIDTRGRYVIAADPEPAGSLCARLYEDWFGEPVAEDCDGGGVHIEHELSGQRLVKLRAADSDATPSYTISVKAFRRDFVLAELDPPPPHALPGDPITVRYKVDEPGGDPPWDVVSVDFYLSLGSFYDPSDIHLLTVELTPADMGVWQQHTAVIPTDTPLNAYYLIGLVDRLDNWTEFLGYNNERRAAARVCVGSDLVIDSFTHSPDLASPGSPVTFSLTVRKAGACPAGSFDVGFWSHRDTPPTVAEPPEQKQTVAQLDAGETATLSFTCSSDVVGSHTAWVFVDHGEAAGEGDETNNTEPEDWRVQAVVELAVQSQPVTDVSIYGTHPGKTGYTCTVPDGSSVELTAPATVAQGNTLYVLAGWTLNGVEQPPRLRTVAFTIGVDSTAIVTYALAPSGALLGCGENGDGQLGLGHQADQDTFTAVPGLTDVVVIAAGESMSFAVTSDRKVWACGDNSRGALGLGDTDDHHTFAQVPDLEDILAVAGGGLHALALGYDGRVWACGHNDDGQLGLDDDIERHTFAEVPGMAGVVAIAAGGSHSLALKSDGTVWACGRNTRGQLGLPGVGSRYAFAKVPDLADVIAIAAGGSHSLALKSDGTVWACGEGHYGALGLGEPPGDRYAFTQVPAPQDVVAIAAGWRHSIALRSDGTVWGSGLNDMGQLGRSSPGTHVYAFGQAPGLTDVVAIAGGAYGSLALTNDGTVWLAGRLRHMPTGMASFVAVPDLPHVWAIAAAMSQHGLVLAQASRALTVESQPPAGVSIDGTHPGTTSYAEQLDLGTAVALTAPATVVSGGIRYGFVRWSLNGTAQTPGERTLAFSITEDTRAVAVYAAGEAGTPWSCGYNAQGQLGHGDRLERQAFEEVADLKNAVVAIAAGNFHSLALRGNGTVWACGLNGNGQLGLGDNNYRPRFTEAPGLTGVVAIAAGVGHSLALRGDGTVWASGRNTDGQLGLGGGGNRNTFTQVQALTDVVAIAAGGYHSLAVTSDGSVWTCGSNTEGQLGLGDWDDRDTFTRVQGLTDIRAIAAGCYHSLALTSDGTLWACGRNLEGQLGLGDIPEQTEFAQVTDLTDVVSVAGGQHYTLAAKADGSLYACGSNIYGQLGLPGHPKTFTLVPDLSGVVAVAAGWWHSLALAGDGALWTCGRNEAGQLGLADHDDRDTFTQVPGLSAVMAAAGGWQHSLVLARAVSASLTVQSTPIAGVDIGGTHPGTTNYSQDVPAGAAVDLTAPGSVTQGGMVYTFVRWILNGADQPEGQTTLSFTLDGASTAVALYLAPPGALDVDMEVMVGGTLNVNGPAPKSLGIVAIDPNSNPQETLYAIQIGSSPTTGWLRFVNSGFPHNRDDIFPTGTGPEWRTAAEWAAKRLRGLDPDTEHTFRAKAKLGTTESPVVEAGTYTTNCDCDVNRSGLGTALDYAYIKKAILEGFTIGVDQPWACDVTDDGRVNILDLSATRFRILNP